eukprot:5235936-Prymnesium_polylepis.1
MLGALPQCKFFQSGYCRKGKRCDFSHAKRGSASIVFEREKRGSGIVVERFNGTITRVIRGAYIANGDIYIPLAAFGISRPHLREGDRVAGTRESTPDARNKWRAVD